MFPTMMLLGETGKLQCLGDPPERVGKNINTAWKVFTTSVIVDTLISITALIMGILGALSVIAIPPAAAYTLVAISGVITLAWILGAFKWKGDIFPYAKNVLHGTISSTLKNPIT